MILPRKLSPHPDTLLKLFVFVDDLFQFIDSKQLLLPETSVSGRNPKLSVSELITLSLYRYVVKSADWKHYWDFIQGYHNSEFTSLPDYSNFLKQQKQYLGVIGMMLNLLLALNRVHYTNSSENIMFVDSSDIPVCSNKRISKHKVCRRHAKRGKTTKGWFYGFKLHIVCDTDGNLLSVRISSGNIDDRKMLESLLKELTGLLIGDAGYVSEPMRKKLEKQDIQLFTAVRKTMKRLMTKAQHYTLKRRQRVETTIGVLKQRLSLVTSLPRSVLGHQVHYMLVCLSYCLGRMSSLRLSSGLYLS